MLSLKFLCLDGLHAPSPLCFYVGGLKAMFLSSFSGITTSIPQESAACAFITRDQRLSFSDACQLRPNIALTEPEQLNNLIQLSRGCRVKHLYSGFHVSRQEEERQQAFSSPVPHFSRVCHRVRLGRHAAP